MVESVQCPVCTLYLHAGMNLSDHLETHPKEQVIKALVQMTIVGNGSAVAGGMGSALAAAMLAGVSNDAASASATAAATDVKPAVTACSVGVATTAASTTITVTTTTTTTATTDPTAAAVAAKLSATIATAASTSASSSSSSSSSKASTSSASGLLPPLRSSNTTVGANISTISSGNHNTSTNNNNSKLNNPPIKQEFEGPASDGHGDSSGKTKPLQFARTPTTEAVAATPTTSSMAATGAYQQTASMSGDYRFEQQSQHQQQQQLHAFQHNTRAGVTTGTTLALPQAAQQQQQQQHQQQHHHYMAQQTHRQQQQQPHYQQQLGMKFAYATSLPPPPPLQLFTQQPTAAQSTQHQKPPPAYGTAISQIRSQHNQNKQQQQQQQQQQQHITIHQIAPPTATTAKHSRSNAAAHTEIFLNPPPPPPPPQQQQQPVMPVSLKYVGDPTPSTSTRLQTQHHHSHSHHPHHQQQAQLLHQHHHQQHQHQPQPQQQSQSTSHSMAMPLQPYASLLPLATAQQKPSSSCQAMPARAAVSSRQTNSPFALLTAAAAAACASPSSVLRYAESPVAHYLERENGDFIVQETPKHIVECVEKEDGEFSVIERIYQSPPSVLHIHDDDEDDDDDDDDDDGDDDEDDDDEGDNDNDDGDEQQTIEEPDERESNRSRTSFVATATTTAIVKKQRSSKPHKPKAGAKSVKHATKHKLKEPQDDDDFMSISSGAESDEPDDKPQALQATAASTPPPLCAAPASSNAAATAATHAAATPNTSDPSSNSNTNSSVSGSGSGSGTIKSKKNRITVLSDVPLNMNEYLDLVGNIVASSRIGAARPFAAIAPIPLVKVEKEEPLDDDDELMARFPTHSVGPTDVDQQLEGEQKPCLEDQLQLHGGNNSSCSSSHATTSVIRMASTNAQQQQLAAAISEDLTQPPFKVEATDGTAQLTQRFAAPTQQRGPKKLVIKPKSNPASMINAAAAAAAATATTTKTKKTDNSTNTPSSSGSGTGDGPNAAHTLSISKPLTDAVQIKSEVNELPSTSGSSILEKHLTATSSYAAGYTATQQSRKHSAVNDDDARVLLEFANSKQPLVDGVASTTFVVNASFPSAGSVFASNAIAGNSGISTQKCSSAGEEYILPDNNLDVDEIVISSSSSYASSTQQQPAQISLPGLQQQQQQQQATTPSFNEFNFLYQATATCFDSVAKSTGTPGINFAPFNFQQQQQQTHGVSDATNAATVASSSSSSSTGSALMDHDSMNATFRVAKAARDQQQQQQAIAGSSSWYQHHTHPHDGAQPTNFNAALAAVDCCSVAVDSDASDAKYLDLDACKREQLSGSSSNSNSLGTAMHLPRSASASASTTSSSFAAAATESSLVGGLNIRTDEKMPAKGEISEQESNCDVENSWSQSMYGDISQRYFRNQFQGGYNQMPEWRQDYYPQDLSPQQRENKRFDFRLPASEGASNAVADYLFASQDDQDVALSGSATHASITSTGKKAKRKAATSTATAASGSSSSSNCKADHSHGYLLGAKATTSSSALLAGPPIASTSKAAAAAAAAIAISGSSSATTTMSAAQALGKPSRRKIFKCPHCDAIYEKLKDRNTHMINDHNYVRQNRRLICTQTAMASATITSGSAIAQPLPPQLQLMIHASSSSSSAMQYDGGVVEDSKDGIVKIKQEHCQEQQHKLSRRNTLTSSTLDPLRTESELPDVKDAGLLVEPSVDDIKPHDVVLAELYQKPHIPPLAMTTPAAKLAALYRMLINYNESKLGQERSISELEQKAMEKSIFLCYVCRTDFPSVKLYDAHLTEHPAECFTCGKKFYRWKNFSLHLKRHLGWKEFGCYVCDKKFVVRSALVEHMRMHTGQTPLKCKICGKKFKRYSNLTQHRKRHTKMMVRKKEYVCHCGEVLPSKARFLWHKETHDLKPKCCPYCCDRFVHANSLRRHIRLAHSDKFDYAEPMECPVCKQIFAKTSIKAHMATHSTDPQYDCAICNKSFSTKWNLKIHSWVHANRTAKPFKCEYCPKAFVRELDFKNHMNAHKQIKPYTCEYCGCKFIRKYNYMRHRREHHGNKKFTCDQCDKSFHRHYYLIEHRRIHTGERPFQCTICGKSSTTKTNHNKHLKIHHSRDPFTVEV